tara:strand:+ start:189 stop:1019 length:831 start_codon:yes stop_codon:yes gene_type:complete
MYVPDMIKREGRRRKLSPRTIKSYSYCVERFFKRCGKDPKRVSKKDIREYLDKWFVDKDACGNTLNVELSALKFFFEGCLGKNMKLNIKYSKKPKHLPIVLTQEETRELLNSIVNIVHRLMIELMYSAGLRVSELVNLKVRDFEFKSNYAWVRSGKGDKDRRFILARNVKNRLVKHVEDNEIDYNSWVFEGRNGHITTRSIHEIIRKACRIAGIKKKAGPHTLRHSFATHLIENGYDVATVQGLLGHSSLDTTMIYVHIANPKLFNVTSPLDSLEQ